MQPKVFLSLLSKARFSLRPTLRHGLFAFMVLAFVMMGLRVQEMAHDVFQGQTPPIIAPASAEEAAHGDAKGETKADTKDAKADEKAAEKPADKATDKADAKPAEEPAAAAKPADAKAEAAKPDAHAASGEGAPAVETPRFVDPDSYSQAEVNILKNLSTRRQELEKRGRELDQREALLKVTELRVDRKIGELKDMQNQVRQAIGAATAEQKARTDSMVKIYETMKAKDAARIFENLDLRVLLDVVGHMKEARSAPILAAMDPKKAKEVTTALMEKKPLPQMP